MPLYFYPNRPTLVPPDPVNPMTPAPDFINSLEASGKYVAEQKWNGDNCLVYTTEMQLWNRHHARLAYRPTPEMLAALSTFPRGSLINGELVNSKTKTVKNLLVVHCVMQWAGQLMNGKPWGESRFLLEKHFQEHDMGSQVVLSKIWLTGFWDLYQAADGAIIEGIVLKDPRGKIQLSTTPLADVNWMLKIRKPCKKYQF